MKTLLSVLFALATVFAASDASAAWPTMTDSVCSGAVTVDKLVKIEVKKGDLKGCPEGLRTPYLCAMHKAGYSQRSLGYAMRHTIADLGDGTCGRVNMRGALVYKSDGTTVAGDKLVDPSRKMAETGLRFGAWKTRVLYLSPGEAELAMCQSDLATANAQVDKMTAKKAVVCPACPKAECPKTECPACVVTKCPICPECPESAPSPTAQELHDEVERFNALTVEHDALQKQRYALLGQITNLQGVTTKAASCYNEGKLYDPSKNACVTSSEALVEFQVRSAALQKQVYNLLPVTEKVERCRAGNRLYDPVKMECARRQ